jgi:hypothetical protein
MFRITKLVSLARHAHDDHHFVQRGLFGKGEYPRHLGVPTPPKQEAASDTSMKRPSPNHTGEKCNLQLLCRTMHSRIWPHHKGAALSRPLRNGRRITESAQNRKPNIAWSSSVQRQSSRPVPPEPRQLDPSIFQHGSVVRKDHEKAVSATSKGCASSSLLLKTREKPVNHLTWNFERRSPLSTPGTSLRPTRILPIHLPPTQV